MEDRERDSTLLRGPAALQDISTCTWRQVEVTAWQSRAGTWVPLWLQAQRQQVWGAST